MMGQIINGKIKKYKNQLWESISVVKKTIIIIILALILFFPKTGFSDGFPINFGLNMSSQFVPNYATRIHLMLQLFNYKQLISYESSFTSLAIWPYKEKENSITYRLSSNLVTFPFVLLPLIYTFTGGSKYLIIPVVILLIPNSKFVISIVKNFNLYIGENTDYFFTYHNNIFNTETVIGLRYQSRKWAFSIEGKKPWMEKYRTNNNIQFQINMWYYFFSMTEKNQ